MRHDVCGIGHAAVRFSFLGRLECERRALRSRCACGAAVEAGRREGGERALVVRSTAFEDVRWQYSTHAPRRVVSGGDRTEEMGTVNETDLCVLCEVGGACVTRSESSDES